MGHRV